MSSSRELLDELIRGRKVERVGLTDWFWPDTLAAWVEQGYPTRRVYKEVGEQRWRRQDGMWEDAKTAGEYEEPVPPWQHFGYDIPVLRGPISASFSERVVQKYDPGFPTCFSETSM